MRMPLADLRRILPLAAVLFSSPAQAGQGAAVAQSYALPNSLDGRPAFHFLAACAATAAEELFLTPEGETDRINALQQAVGRYVRLACVASNRASALAAYEQYRLSMSEKSAVLDQCESDACRQEGAAAIAATMAPQLLSCLDYQRRHLSLLRAIPPAANKACSSLD